MGLKHSEVIAKLLKLQAIDYDRCTAEINSLIKNTTDLTVGVSHLDDNLNTLNAKLISLLSEYKPALNNFEQKLKGVLAGSVDDYLKLSEETWQQNVEKMTFEEHKDWSKKWPPVSEEREEFIQFCTTYCTWQLPGMIYGAKMNTGLLNAASGTDPMYLVEKFPQYIDVHKQILSPEQIRKIRVYNADDLNLLPKNIIGVIVVYNEFPFLPWDMIKSLMYKFNELLSPGGHLIFNYNNCNTHKGFIQFENKLMTYTTPDMFLSFGKTLGLEPVRQYNSATQAFSYMSLQKAGSKKLVKKHASLGYIRQQPTVTGPGNPEEMKLKHQQRIELIRKLASPK